MKGKRTKQRSLNIRDIAKMAGVSCGTVSRVLNNRPRVSEKTRRKVLAIVKEHEYYPNVFAKGLKIQQSHSIGLLVTNITYSFFPEIIRGIEQYAGEKGFNVMLTDSNGSLEQERMRLSMLLSKRVDGIIASPIDFLGDKSNIDVYYQFANAGIPVVFVNNILGSFPADSIAIDNLAASEMAMEHLISLGHRRIAFLADVFESRHIREAGYRNVLRRRGIPVDERLVVWRDQRNGIRGGIGDELDGYELGGKVLIQQPRPTAIFASNDAMAIGCYRRISETGLSVPEDVSLIGFDDIEVAAYLPVPLTSVAQPKEEMGRVAAEMLFSRIEEKEPRPAQRILLQGELRIRRSTGPRSTRPIGEPNVEAQCYEQASR